jgi:hypothetical protein
MDCMHRTEGRGDALLKETELSILKRITQGHIMVYFEKALVPRTVKYRIVYFFKNLSFSTYNTVTCMNSLQDSNFQFLLKYPTQVGIQSLCSLIISDTEFLQHGQPKTLHCKYTLSNIFVPLFWNSVPPGKDDSTLIQ